MNRFLQLTVLIFSISLYFIACTSRTSNTWYTYYNDLGTYSSPRLIDLNDDGVMDIIMGAGGKEDERSDSSVIAVDGYTGRLIWNVKGFNQYVGSAIFMDINGDKVPDVFIGGRWAQFSAIDGKNGTLIWTFYSERSTPHGGEGGWFNFSTPQFIPDQDNDGMDDIIVSNGGNSLAVPSDTNRPAGKILILSSTTGKLLADVTVPDKRETYMSVVCYTERPGNKIMVLFGTGGETIRGHLYKTSLDNIMKGDISGAEIIAENDRKGFIAPPVLADITGDSIYDIIVNKVDGEMVAVNGLTHDVIWKVRYEGSEAYTTPAVGDFNADGVPDFFCNFAIGSFPVLEHSIRFMVNGKTGKVEYQDTIHSFQYASAVAADFNDDGFDDVLVNQSELKRKQFEDVYFSYLLIFDFRNRKQYPVGDTMPATNLASTPWIGDMDGDRILDIVYCAVKYDDIRFNLQKPLGLMIGHYRSSILIRKSVLWGSYMGSRYNGIYPLSADADGAFLDE